MYIHRIASAFVDKSIQINYGIIFMRAQYLDIIDDAKFAHILKKKVSLTREILLH